MLAMEIAHLDRTLRNFVLFLLASVFSGLCAISIMDPLAITINYNFELLLFFVDI